MWTVKSYEINGQKHCTLCSASCCWQHGHSIPNQPRSQHHTTSDNARAGTERNEATAIAADHSERRARLLTVGWAIRTSSTNHTDLLDQSIRLAESISSAIGTKIQKESHWDYWLEFLHLINEDVQAFGATSGESRASRQTRQEK